jgi:hypothetical protein
VSCGEDSASAYPTSPPPTMTMCIRLSNQLRRPVLQEGPAYPTPPSLSIRYAMMNILTGIWLARRKGDQAVVTTIAQHAAVPPRRYP